MPHKTLIDTQTLADHLDEPEWIIFDCRFSLTDPEAGRKAYAEGHIPGARYAHLNDDLSSPVTPASGRHPLPSPKTLAEKLGRWGVDRKKQVIAYDENGGAFAARLWWLLRWLGHEAVAVLDGDLRKWRRENRPISDREPPPKPASFQPTISSQSWVDSAEMEQIVAHGTHTILDARAKERFSGAVEPLDKRAGHIPGARNAPFQDNLDADGRFLTADTLRARFERYLSDMPPTQIVHMCGSGVTACHNLLAMEHAGLAGARLYPGSWSEWIADSAHLVAQGENP